ncbi:hypothetical protein TNIN_461861 [Trichonephila inaurata madagascariensis]|uniref:Uncharacterized protein n=1 Tax=Trichonephila inaurata madagascariensis TaxID=2747483 RepID=A0A8X6M8Y4_9ARAC|nr:hypothetical protein TNIN_461861 [Trichonephila inaurata madagascariensis]
MHRVPRGHSIQGTNSDNAVRRTKGQHGHLDGSFQTEDQKPSPFPFRLFIRPISTEELINLIQVHMIGFDSYSLHWNTTESSGLNLFI